MSEAKRWAQKMSRRRFLQRLTVLGAGLAAACVARERTGAPTPFDTATPARLLPSPQVPVTGGAAAGSATPAAQAGALSLDQFLQFSSLLTGVDHLDPVLGQVYLQALVAGSAGGPALAAAYSAASAGANTLPKDVEALTRSGFFKQQGMRDLAVQITDLWYSGVYSLNGEDHVATYGDALAWKVLHFTKPPSICGSFGFWATQPNVQLSPSVEYTPAPTPAQ